MATPNRQDVLNLLQERKGLWRQRYGITRLGLFGSLARGEARPDSDVDLCVSLDPPNPFCLVHFKQEVEQALQVLLQEQQKNLMVQRGHLLEV